MMIDNGRLLRWAPWLASVVLLASLAVAGWAYLRDHAHQEGIEHDRSLIVTSERLLSAMKDVENGERGFIITGRDNYLEPYNWGLAAVPADAAKVTNLIGPEADTLARLIDDRLQEAAEGIAVYRQQGAAAGAAKIDTGTGKALMDRVRVEVARLQHDADARIAVTTRQQRRDDLLRLASVIGLVAACLLIAGLALLRRRQQRSSQRLFEGVLENAPVGLGILDTELRIRHVNHALAAMSERALSAAPGMSIWDVIPQLRDTLEPRLQRVLGGGRATTAEVEATSNTRVEQTRSYQANFYPLQQGGGGTDRGVGMVIADTTARKRAERAVQESEARFRSLVEANTAMIWTTDAEGAFVKPQPAWMRFTGQSEVEAQGWGRFACVHPDDRARTAEAWRIGKDAGQPINLENRLRRHDGAWRHMAVTIVPVKEENVIREWVGSHADITDRKEAEQALADAKDAAEAANRAKSAFLANMSHELRTPLSAVIGYSEMLEEDAEEKGDTAGLTDLGKIKSNAKHLLGLINDVLDLSKVEANKMDLFAEDFAVAAFVHDAAGTVDALIARKSNSLVIDVDDATGTMHTDAVKLRQCLFNLLSNAAKFTENGTITLSARREHSETGDWVVFAVRDTGIGMTPEQLTKLFQRFAQADETTTRKFGGTGLGLALSRAFARLLGGDIHVESVEGQGTCFTLRLPALLPERVADPEAATTVDAGTDAVMEQGGRQGDLVLVIDDEASQRDLMSRFLQRQGFAVQVAADGVAGLELARSVAPRVILLDVMMPGMDGWAVLNALKADPLTADIPVVMVSFVADANLSAALGAAEAVPKPVDWSRLKAVMDRLRAQGSDVLVVDDDADMRDRLRSVLERNGWSVSEAANGVDALDAVTRAPPHLILLDLTMPVMDGFVFLHRLRQTPGCSDIPVVVLSARDITRDERDRLASADRILKKGDTSMRDLAAELRSLEGNAESQQP